MKYKKYTLQELATIKYGKNQKKVVADEGKVPIYGTGGLMGYATKSLYDSPSVLIGRKGTIDKVRYVTHPFWTVDTLFYTEINDAVILPHYLYYAFSLIDLKQYNEGTTIPSLRTETLNRIEFYVPSITEQKELLSEIEPIDEKIELNQSINKNLFAQVMALYKHFFTESVAEYNSCRADEYFDITIGKTPPRKEREWFSTNQKDERWVSISDMGNCGLYISNTSERLTHDAIRRFNIVIVPDNTVLLSFKLTVGRLAITDGEMVTNEAIAHFKTDKAYINPYLFCYLKSFNFQSLGSTSSIATAVNSKIIKAMPFVIPEAGELQQFNEVALPAFAAIKANQAENRSLSELRDSLLPKLMSGEIDVSDIDL